MNKLILKERLPNMYRGEINEVLDNMFGLIDKSPHLWSYEMKPIYYKEGPFAGQLIVPIRIPGETVGGIWINRNYIITEIRINQNTFHNLNSVDYERIIDYLGKEIVYKEYKEE